LTIDCPSGSILIHDAYRRDGKDCSTPSGVFTHKDPLVALAWLECNLRKRCQIVDKNNRPDSYFAVHYDCGRSFPFLSLVHTSVADRRRS
jgi:hypothetical protein